MQNALHKFKPKLASVNILSQTTVQNTMRHAKGQAYGKFKEISLLKKIITYIKLEQIITV